MGKTILLTGAVSRIGYRIAHALAAAGYNLILHVNRNISDAKILQQELGQIGSVSVIKQADFTTLDASEHQSLLDVPSGWPPPYAVINNACLFERDRDDQDCSRHMMVNVAAPVQLTYALLQRIKSSTNAAQDIGRVVTILDANTQKSFPNLDCYHKSQQQRHLDIAILADKLAPSILVNGLALGPVAKHQRQSEGHFSRLVANTSLQKPVDTDDIIQCLLFMLNTHSMNGQIIRLGL